MSKFSTPPLTYLRLNSKSTFFDHFFSTKVVQMLHLMVFFSYHKSKSPHSSVIFRGLKSYFSQKVRCPNLAHPPNLLEIKFKKYIYFQQKLYNCQFLLFWITEYFPKEEICNSVMLPNNMFFNRGDIAHIYVFLTTNDQKNRKMVILK